jgi:hypothetical protein
MKNLRLLIIALALLTSFSACKKDDAPKVKTTAEKISSSSGKQWKITSLKAKFTIDGQQQEQNVMGLVFPQNCQQDNLSVLFSNKNFEEREGASRCGTSDVVRSGSWELKKDDTELHITTPSLGTIYTTLKEVTETTITGEYPQTFTLTGGGSVDAIVTVIYNAQ